MRPAPGRIPRRCLAERRKGRLLVYGNSVLGAHLRAGRHPAPDNAGFRLTERITSVDKHLLLRAMRELLIRSYGKRGLPYVYLHYYPGNYQSVFVFRVDIDAFTVTISAASAMPRKAASA